MCRLAQPPGNENGATHWGGAVKEAGIEEGGDEPHPHRIPAQAVETVAIVFRMRDAMA